MRENRPLLADTHDRLSPISIVLHWSIAIGMIALIPFGIYIEDLPRGPDKFELIGIHKSLGVILLALALARLAWRLRQGLLGARSEQAPWQHALASTVQWTLLAGTLLMPLSGIMMSVGGGYPVGVFGWEIIAGSEEKIEALSKAGHLIHGLLGKLLIALILLHAAAAIKHQWMDRDGTLSRMLGRDLNR
ncbi:MAG: cytochrome b [gamma proteobacterium symbiont of Phacoides pectinatus]